jgi:YVTN family beta-propeller protein
MKIFQVLIFTLPFILASCNKNDPDPVIEFDGPLYLKGEGVFIVNEGNYLAGNGSLSFFSYDSLKMYNNVFTAINNRPLGDVPNSMILSSDKGYVVVNNSGSIEVTDRNTVKSSATFTGLNSPRNILKISNQKAYVSSMYSERIAVLDLISNTVSGYINIRRSSEAMLLAGKKVYVSNWISGNEIMIINALTDKVTDSIEVGNEPESMVLDKYNKLWILCSGGYSGLYFPELVSVNTATDEIDKRIAFQSKSIYPTSLQINKTRDTLYYIERSLWKMPVTSSSLPDGPFVRSSGRLFYKMGVDPVNGQIFATNAVDYQQKGYVIRISPKGLVIDSMKTDIIPGSLCFKRNLN